MNRKANWRVVVAAILYSLALSGCGSGGGSGGGGSDDADDNVNPDAALLALFEQLFPFTPNQTFDVVFQCARLNSVLLYTFDFRNDGTFNLYSTTDVPQDIGPFPGTYTYQNGILNLQLTSVFLNLNESSTSITPAFGLVGIFQTPNMICGAIGHRENAAEFGTRVHYDCPIINQQAVSYDENDIEFVHQAVPFGFNVPGSAFRHRDRWISGAIQPLILRGYGLYRRVGNDFYVFFASGTFDDFNVLQGVFKNGDLQLSVNQLEPARGDCILR